MNNREKGGQPAPADLPRGQARGADNRTYGLSLPSGHSFLHASRQLLAETRVDTSPFTAGAGTVYPAPVMSDRLQRALARFRRGRTDDGDSRSRVSAAEFRVATEERLRSLEREVAEVLGPRPARPLAGSQCWGRIRSE